MNTAAAEQQTQQAAGSYHNACDQMLGQVLHLLEPNGQRHGKQTKTAPPMVMQMAGAALALRRFLSTTQPGEVRRLIPHMMDDPNLPATAKILAANHYCTVCQENPSWLLPYLKLDVGATPAQQCFMGNLALWARQYTRARTCYQAAAHGDPAMTADFLANMAAFWQVQDLDRAAVLCWNQARRIQPLSPTQQLALCQCLLARGRFHAANRLSADLPETGTQEDQLRRLFIRQITVPGPDSSLFSAARELLAQFPAMPSTMRVFAPAVVQLGFRLEALTLSGPHRRLARGYAQILRAEWSLGRYFQDSLLSGSRLLVFAGLLEDAMAVMAQRQQADAAFVDGYAALAIYAWMAGLAGPAEACLAHEPTGRPHDPMGWFRLALAAGLLKKPAAASGFLEQLHAQAPDFFAQSGSVPLWSMAAILLKTLGWPQLANMFAARSQGHRFWQYRRKIFECAPTAGVPVPLPAFRWPENTIV